MDELTPDHSESASGATRERTPWKWLLLVVLVGLALRLGSLTVVISNAEFRWVDADHYMTLGKDVASVPRPFGERVVRAAAYQYLGWTFYLPPLYTLTLALFALCPYYPLNAAIGQAVLGAISVLFVFVIGRHLHSERIGLIAAALYAMWPTAASGADVFRQEQLYVPLVLAGLALLASVLGRDRPWMHFATGVVFGLAALTRLMILFYLLFVPVLIWLARRNRATVSRQILPLVLGAAIVVVPYSAFMSWSTGQLMLVENHGGFDMRNYSDRVVVGKPTVGVGLQVLFDQATRRPLVFIGTWLEYVRLLFKPNGMRWIEGLGISSTRLAALFAVGLRVVYDSLYLVAIGLTPLGVLLARRRRLAVALVAWVLVLTAFTTLSGAAGARYRTPVEPVLLAFAATAVGCPWRGRARGSLLLAGVVGALLVLRVAAQIPGFGTLPPYGLRSWSPELGTGESTGSGDVGFRVQNAANGVHIVVQSAAALKEPVRFEVTVDGYTLFDRVTDVNTQGVRVVWVREGTPYLRIRATGDRSASPIPFRFTILRRSAGPAGQVDPAGTRAP